jgi:hypothetical protein
MKLITLPLYMVATLLSFVGGVVMTLGWIVTCLARTLEEVKMERIEKAYLVICTVIILCIIGLAMSGCTNTKYINHIRPYPILFMKLDSVKVDTKNNIWSKAIAIANCDSASNRSFVVMDTLQFGREYWNQIITHENQHVEDASNYPGGCRKYNQKYAVDAMFRFTSEARAECAEVRSHPRNKWEGEIEKRLGTFRSPQFPSFSEQEVRERLTFICHTLK